MLNCKEVQVIQVRRIVHWVNSWSGVTLVPGAHSLFSDGEPTQTSKISQKKYKHA